MMRRVRWFSLILLFAGAATCRCQPAVHIQVDAAKTTGLNSSIWSYFGNNEPNYTTAPNGRKLLGELGALSPTPVFIRVHNLLTTGVSTGSLKWGSTNAYTEDANGNPVYDWRTVDAILDTLGRTGTRPLIEIGFMPESLSTHPEPYRHRFPEDKNVFTGWSYPPKDYAKWGELVYRLAEHCGIRYGVAAAASWRWEVWNEPDIPYWHGTPEEYDRLYDVTTAAVRRALPTAKVGGPATTGPGSEKAAAFLRQFLQHCVNARAPLDFVTFHAKGSPKISEGEVRMGLAKHLQDIATGFAIVRSFPQFKDLPIVLSESDPEGCAACAAPQNAYRNGTLYAVYLAASMNAARQLAASTGANLQGFLTWAFEFENQPYFAGLRSLATNGIDQPVLNVFRMFGLMQGVQVAAVSDGAEPVQQILSAGVAAPETDVFATRAERSVSVMVWNYEDRDRAGPGAQVQMSISGLPDSATRCVLRHWRIDASHSNSYAAWKRIGLPQQPSPEQVLLLQAAGQLEAVDAPSNLDVQQGKAAIEFQLPEQGVSLLQVRW